MNTEKERIRKAIYGKLRTLHRKLAAAGISCRYTRSVLSHDADDVSFKITCQPSNDGDLTVLPRLSVRSGDTVETFDESNIEDGLVRLREVLPKRQ
jgi:hypothetical protein